jgi:type I restriction enzyme S subunit
MALCVQLEAGQKEREAQRDALRSASLQRLSQVDDDVERATDVRFFLDKSRRLITKREHVAAVRQTILDLAVRGRLVDQDPGDTPVEILITRIQTEAGQGTRRPSERDRRNPVVGSFVIPTGWKWVRLGDLVVNRDGERVPVSKEERSTRAKTYDYYGASGVIDKTDSYLFDTPLLLIGEDGANLVNRSTPIAFIARGQYWVNNHAHVLDGTTEEFLRYIELFVNAIDLKPYLTGTAQPKMNQAKMNGIPVAVPPEAEQHRIVARVDDLMAVCDDLESALASAQMERRRLLEALLQDALEGSVLAMAGSAGLR